MCGVSGSDMCGQCPLVNALTDQVNKLRKERENNPGVWDGAPNNARYVAIGWFEHSGRTAPLLGDTHHTRTLPKTKAREIAEKWADTPTPTPTRQYLANLLEAAINEAMEGEK